MLVTAEAIGIGTYRTVTVPVVPAIAVVVHVPPSLQRARLRARDGLGEAEAEARLAAQMPIDEKARRADVVVSNEGDLASLRARAAPLLADLRRGLGRRLPNAPPARY